MAKSWENSDKNIKNFSLDSEIGIRRCFITSPKIKDQQNYGLILKTTQISDNVNHEIVQVEKNSIAFKAGLQENDIILEINGRSVKQMDHKQVISNIIDSDLDSIEILVTKK